MKFIAFFRSQELELEGTTLETALKRARAIETSVSELGELVAIEKLDETITSDEFVTLGEE